MTPPTVTPPAFCRSALVRFAQGGLSVCSRTEAVS